MTEKITGIVLNVRKYNDRNSIVTLYTRERGRLAFISPAGSGKASNVRRARLQPLSVVTTELRYKPTSELQRLNSVTPSEVWRDLYFQPSKLAMVVFISEFLDRLLVASAPDPALFDFLIDSIRLLDRLQSGVVDFHIPFLVSLLSYSGIQPDTSGYSPGRVFDFASGAYVYPSEVKGPFLEGVEAESVRMVSRINFSNIKKLRLTSVNRRQILYGLLNYYSYHFPGLGSLKSPEILRELFS